MTRDELKARWLALPPLVRAGVAAGMAAAAADRAGKCYSFAHDDRELGMERRAHVGRAQGAAHVVIRDWFALLANEADAEAVERGIDADTDGAALAGEGGE